MGGGRERGAEKREKFGRKERLILVFDEEADEAEDRRGIE